LERSKEEALFSIERFLWNVGLDGDVNAVILRQVHVHIALNLNAYDNP
jgi:hypothetical protein